MFHFISARNASYSNSVRLRGIFIALAFFIYLAGTASAQTTFTGTPQTIDSTGSVGQYTSHAVVNGNPAISYRDVTNNDLKFVRANDANGTTWGAPVTLDSTGVVGAYTSLAVVNGNPAISYYDLTNGNLKYIRSTDANGTTWGAPVTPASTGNVGAYLSLAVVNGNPAISYYDFDNSDLKYIRSTDANGTTWGAPVTLDSTGNVGLFTSLAVINGNPAISYNDDTNSNLKYIRSTNANGTTWGTPVTLDSTGSVGLFTSLTVVNGNPAISYSDNTNSNLKYIRSTDPSGMTLAVWGTPITLDSTGNVGQYSSLAVVNGNPAISYSDNTNNDLKYIRSTDPSGMTLAVWGTPLTLDSTGNVGEYSSLAVVNGNPAISYSDGTNGDLKYIRSTHVKASGTGSGDWDDPANWQDGTVPADNSDVYLADSTVPANTNIDAADVVVRDLTLGANRTVTISGNHTLTINGTLSMNGGNITAAPGSRVVFGCNGAVTGASATDFIVGDTEKQFCATGTFTYPVGETTGTAEFSPMTATITALATNPSSLTVSVTDTFLPDSSTTNSVSRYWTVTETGDLTATMAFTYLDGDVNGSETNYKVLKREGGFTTSSLASTVNAATNTGTVTGVSNFSDWSVGTLVALAASVDIGGRIVSQNGSGVGKARVIMIDQNGAVRTAMTSPFGYYLFEDVSVGQTVTVNAQHKQFTFAPQVVTVTEDVGNLNFTATP